MNVGSRSSKWCSAASVACLVAFGAPSIAAEATAGVPGTWQFHKAAFDYYAGRGAIRMLYERAGAGYTTDFAIR